VIEDATLTVAAIPREALFLAGKAFLRYRRSRGTERSVLPDFYIGAHAAVMQWPILTRDASRYKTYYPTVSLITPLS
jgi:predicted nucleic acid-binding protein